MASWEAKKTTASSINLGNRFNNGDSIDAEDINAVVEAALYAQEVETYNKNVELQVQNNMAIILGQAQELKKIKKDLPLAFETVAEFGKTYNTLKGLYESGATADSLSLSWFNRTPDVGERFFAVGKTGDKRNIGFGAEVVEIDGEYAKFKFLDFVLLGEDYPMLNRTMAFTGVTPEDFTATDASGNYTFKGYNGHHSIGVEFFSIPPRVGNHFFGTVLLKGNASDEYPTIATFTAVVTAITNNKVDYSIVDATILHNASLDQAVETGTLLYKQQVFNLGDTVSDTEWHRADFFLYDWMFNRTPKKGETFKVIGLDSVNNLVYFLTFEIGYFDVVYHGAITSWEKLSNTKNYRHQIISGSFLESSSPQLYIISPSATPLTTAPEVGGQIQKAQTKLYVSNGVSYSQVLSVFMPSTVYYLNDSGTITSGSLSFSSFEDKVTEI